MALEISAPFQLVEAVEAKECVNPAYQPRWELAKVLFAGNLAVICALEKAVQVTDYDTISVALVTLFRMYHRAQKLLRLFINKEIQETSEAATLFRGVSLTTKMVSAFCMQEGQAYCKNILDPCLKMFCADEVSVEVDPTKLNPDENLEINQAKLLGVCKGLLNHITRSVENCSYPLRKMFWQTRRLVAKRFPEHHLRVVGGFYFLRFLCPALVCPEGFGLISGPPAAKSRRSLILVSKIVQNLANDVEFGEKESYMIKANTFIKSNQTTMWAFMEQLSNPPPKPRDTNFLELKQDPLAALYPCIAAHKDKIGNILQKGGHSGLFEDLCRALENYATGTIVKPRPGLHPHAPTDAKKHPTSSTPSSTPSSAPSSLPPLSTSHAHPYPSTTLSPTSSKVADLIPVITSPSNSLSNLLQIDFTFSSAQEISAQLQVNLEKKPEKSEPAKSEEKPEPEKSEPTKSEPTKAEPTKPEPTKTEPSRTEPAKPEPTKPEPTKATKPEPTQEKSEPKEEKSEPAHEPHKEATHPSPRIIVPSALRDVEEDLKKQMQEIQALKLALESGGMGLKERGETQVRFAGLLQHLKTTLAAYKEMKEEAAKS